MTLTIIELEVEAKLISLLIFHPITNKLIGSGYYVATENGILLPSLFKLDSKQPLQSGNYSIIPYAICSINETRNA